MIESTKQFNTTLKSIGTSSAAINKNVQLCCMFAFDQFLNHSGNTDPMDRLHRKVIACKGIASDKVKDYVEAHANVKWRKETKKDKDGNEVEVYRFIRNKGEDADVTTPTVDWMDYAKAKSTSKPKVDPDVVIANALKKIEKAMTDKNLKSSIKRAQTVMKAIAFAMEHADDLDHIKKLIASDQLTKEVVTELKKAA